MVVQVGDKVLVYGAGTPWAFAKKIEPVQVGDKVDVVTLSDGTKLAMPKIELDLSDFVWVLPEWDLGFNFGDLPFGWGMMPLGAAVFTISGYECFALIDSDRSWEDMSLTGCLIFMLSGMRKNQHLVIASNTDIKYIPQIVSNPHGPIDQALDDIGAGKTWEPSVYYHKSGTYWWYTPPEILPSEVYFKCNDAPNYSSPTSYEDIEYITQRMNLSGVRTIKVKLKGWVTYNFFDESSWRMLKYSITASFSGSSSYSGSISLTKSMRGGPDPLPATYSGKNLTYRAELNERYGILTATSTCSNWWVFGNVDWPDYTEFVLEVPENVGHNAHDVTFMLQGAKTWNFSGSAWAFHELHVWIDSVHFYDIAGNELIEPCTTGGINIGDKYVIYNPVTKRLVFNDSNKTILASPYWRDITGPGDEITIDPIQYAWDGAGQVYLSQSKTTLSTIFYDDEIQVSNLAAGKTKTIPYHSHDPYTYEGETVSRELVNITGILRAGMNEITLSVRDTTGNKIGFPTPVYIVRSMS